MGVGGSASSYPPNCSLHLWPVSHTFPGPLVQLVQPPLMMWQLSSEAPTSEPALLVSGRPEKTERIFPPPLLVLPSAPCPSPRQCDVHLRRGAGCILHQDRQRDRHTLDIPFLPFRMCGVMNVERAPALASCCDRVPFEQSPPITGPSPPPSLLILCLIQIDRDASRTQRCSSFH